MRFLLVVATLILMTPLSSLAQYYGKAYVDKEDGQFLSVFSDPGVDYDTCQKNKSCEAMGWLDNKSDVEIISPPVKVPKLDVYTKKVVDTEFVQIQFSYDRINPDGNPARKTNVIGWVESASLTREKVATFYGSDPEPEPPCPPQVVNKPKTAPPVVEARNVQRITENKAVVATADAISPYIGQCVINPKRLPNSYKSGNTYDNYVMPTMNKQPVPNLIKEDGTAVTRQDMIDIDALSRTMYSEMARCYKHGLHYPSAVARITLNRASANGRRSEFINGYHASGKGDIAKAATSPFKYSAWNHQEGNKRNPVLAQALCPPAPGNSVMWTGRAVTKNEKEIWDDTIRIATETVLYPKKFKARAPALTQFFYTSDLDRPKWKQVKPKVEGRSLNKDYCMMIWQD